MHRQVRVRSLVSALVMLLLGSCDSVAFVDRIEIVNNTEYTATVEVRGDTLGWVVLTTVEPQDTNQVGMVIDQGPSWTFSFKYGNHDAITLTMSKAELLAADWRVEVPIGFEEDLQARGVPPPS